MSNLHLKQKFIGLLFLSLSYHGTNIIFFFFLLLDISIWLICCCSVGQLCLTLCNPMDCKHARLPVFDHLSELAPTHSHGVSDAIQPAYPVSPPSPPAISLSQHQGLFQWNVNIILEVNNLVFNSWQSCSHIACHTDKRCHTF